MSWRCDTDVLTMYWRCTTVLSDVIPLCCGTSTDPRKLPNLCSGIYICILCDILFSKRLNIKISVNWGENFFFITSVTLHWYTRTHSQTSYAQSGLMSQRWWSQVFWKLSERSWKDWCKDNWFMKASSWSLTDMVETIGGTNKDR